MLGVPLGAQLFGDNLLVGLGGDDVVVDAEVWHEVVDWVRGWIGWLPSEERLSIHVQLSVSLNKLERGIFCWYDPFSILILFWLPFSFELFRDNLLVVLGGDDIVIDTKIWDKVINWMGSRVSWLPCKKWLSIKADSRGVADESNDCKFIHFY